MIFFKTVFLILDTYNLPKIELTELHEQFMVIPSNSKKTLYEMVCEKELVRKELLEAKESFSNCIKFNSKHSIQSALCNGKMALNTYIHVLRKVVILLT